MIQLKLEIMIVGLWSQTNFLVMEDIYSKTSDITSAKIIVFTRGMIPGYGASSGFEVHIQDQKGGKLEDLQKITNDIIAALNERPEISRASTSFDTKYPQYLLEVDAARCKRNGVSPGEVLNVMAGYVGGSYASNMNRFSKLRFGPGFACTYGLGGGCSL